jgi:integrase
MPHRLTDAFVRRIEPPAKGMHIVYDSECPGFGCRTTSAGAKAFVLNYRVAGRQRQITLGSFPDWPTAQARERARELRREVDVGKDPLGERQKLLHAPTVADLAKHYIEHHLPRKRPSSVAIDRANLRNHVLPALGSRKVESITHADIASLHRKIKAPVMANRILALVSTMLGLAIKLEWIATNPAKGVERHPEHPRQRFLTSDEIGRLMSALDKRPGPSSNAIRLLLLTGARRMEVMGATWDQFDLDAGIWSKPHTATKQRRLHRVPLGEGALAILRDMRAEADARIADARAEGRIARAETNLFPSMVNYGHKKFIDKHWHTICQQAGIAGCRMHDLRHSFASLLASGGQSLLVIGQMLGHQSPSTTARYSHLFDETLKVAADAVSHAVSAARSAPAKVLPLRVKGG